MFADARDEMLSTAEQPADGILGGGHRLPDARVDLAH
jgi:hypothetical protein